MQLAEMFDKALYQQWNIFAPFAKRGQDDGYDVQPIIKVFPERAIFDHLFKVRTRGSDDSHIDLYCAVATDALKFSFLKDA